MMKGLHLSKKVLFLSLAALIGLMPAAMAQQVYVDLSNAYNCDGIDSLEFVFPASGMDNGGSVLDPATFAWEEGVEFPCQAENVPFLFGLWTGANEYASNGLFPRGQQLPLAIPMASATQTPIDLTGFYNVDAYGFNGEVLDFGMDGGRSVLDPETFPWEEGVEFPCEEDGVPFLFGNWSGANEYAYNGLFPQGQQIDLNMAGVDTIHFVLIATEGNFNDSTKVFTLNYTDGTTEELLIAPQSEWFNTNFVNHNVADSVGRTNWPWDGTPLGMNGITIDHRLFDVDNGKTLESVTMPTCEWAGSRLFVLAMTVTDDAGVHTAIDLTNTFNFDIVAPKQNYGLDGGNAIDYSTVPFASEELYTCDGGQVHFQMGDFATEDALNAVWCDGTEIDVTDGNYAGLNIMVVCANGNLTSDSTDYFIFEYTDGSVDSVLLQPLNDWWGQPLYHRAFTGAVRTDGASPGPDGLLIEHKRLPVDPSKTLDKITVPDHDKNATPGWPTILAMTLDDVALAKLHLVSIVTDGNFLDSTQVIKFQYADGSMDSARIAPQSEWFNTEYVTHNVADSVGRTNWPWDGTPLGMNGITIEHREYDIDATKGLDAIVLPDVEWDGSKYFIMAATLENSLGDFGAIDLSSVYNLDVIYPAERDNSRGMDRGRNVLDSETFGFNQGDTVACPAGDAAFVYGPWEPFNASNMIFAEGQTVNMPRGMYTTVNMSLTVTEGNLNDSTQVFVFNYTDGSADSVMIAYQAEWFATPLNHKALEGVKRVDGNAPTGGLNIEHVMYFIDNTKVLRSITFPANDTDGGSWLYVLAITLDPEDSDVEDVSVIPLEYKLNQNYPNPFNPETQISFSLPMTGKVHLAVYNVLGQQVKTLIDKNMMAGVHEVRWDGTNNAGQTLANGMYIYRLKTAMGVKTSKMMFMK